MTSSAVPALAEPFALPAFHEDLRAQAEEQAARFAASHRDVRLHPFGHGELHPGLWREIRGRGWPGLLVPAAQVLGAQAWDEREGMIDLYLDARAARSAPVSQELALGYIARHVLGLPGHR